MCISIQSFPKLAWNIFNSYFTCKNNTNTLLYKHWLIAFAREKFPQRLRLASMMYIFSCFNFVRFYVGTSMLSNQCKGEVNQTQQTTAFAPLNSVVKGFSCEAIDIES